MNLLERFERVLQQEKFISYGSKVFIACSGGPDSTALFHLFKSVQKKRRLKLGVLHFNHGMRGVESNRDERFVKKFAKANRARFFSGVMEKNEIKKGLSFEEAAREARYNFFLKMGTKHGIFKIALGHNMDDQAETVLMRILQGTGLRGLYGIRPSFRRNRVLFFRPLLRFSRKEILAYLRQNNISFCTDKTNKSPRFLRNRIRLELIPSLAEKFNPNVVHALARIPEITSREMGFLDDLEEKIWGKTFLGKNGSEIRLRRSLFLKWARPLGFRLLDRALKKIDPESGLSFDAWEKIMPHLSERRFRWSLPRDIDFHLTPSRICVYKKNRAL